MKIINTEKQLNLRCPLPTIDEQKRIEEHKRRIRCRKHAYEICKYYKRKKILQE